MKYGKVLRTPYNKGFAFRLRRDIPDSERIWTHASREWWISDAYIQEVRNLIFEFFQK